MTLENPLVDIIIICYNYGQYLSGAIESALNQTYKPTKITVIDDASADETEKVAQKYRQQINYIKNQKNLGLMRTLVKVINNTSAPFFILLSADDELETNCVHDLFQGLKNNSRAAFSYGQVKYFGLQNHLYQSFPFSTMRLIHTGNYISETALIRREAFERIGGYNLNMENGQEDWDLWLSFIEHGYKGIYVPKPIFRYRIHEKSKNYKINIDPQKIRQNISLIRKNHPSLYGFSYWLIHYPYMLYDLIRTKLGLNK